MKITRISAQNFKGRSFVTDLSDITVLVGDNFSGKSSRSEAATLALAGFLPSIERRPFNLYDRLSSGNPMSVQVDFDDGRYIRRDYAKKDSSVSAVVSHRGLNRGWAVEPVLVDADEFLGLSNKERVKFLFQKLTVQGEVITPATLIERLMRSVAAKTEMAVEYIATLEMALSEDHTTALTSGLSPQAWLENAVNRLNDNRKSLALTQKNLVNTVNLSSFHAASMLAMNRTEIRQTAEAAAKAMNDEQSSLNEAQIVLRSNQPTITAAEEELAVAKAERWVELVGKELTKAENELAGIVNMACCPTCGAKNKGWRAKIEQGSKGRVEAAKAEMTKATSALTTASEALSKKQAKIAEVKAKLSSEAAANVEAAKQRYNEAVRKWNESSAAVSAMEQQDREEERQKKVQQDMAKVSTRLEVLVELCNIAQAALDNMVNSSIKPFLDNVNTLCEGILLSAVGYRDGEFGLIKGSDQTGSQFITWRSFSGTEKLLFMAAVSIAFAAQAELKVAFLDEIGRLDDSNKLKVVDRLRNLIKHGFLSQAIVIEAGWSGWWNKHVGNGLTIVEVK